VYGLKETRLENDIASLIVGKGSAACYRLILKMFLNHLADSSTHSPGMRPFSAHTNSQIDSARLVHGAVRRSRISPSAGNVFFANWPDALCLFKWFSLWFSATRMPSVQNGHDV
jgi:hypothetical protein